MTRTPTVPTLIFLAMLPLVSAAAGEGWSEGLARTFSGRLAEINRELPDLEKQLETLPRVPIDDQGGSGGFATMHPTAEPKSPDDHVMAIRWPEESPVERVVLVPARRYDARGLESQYGLPDDFVVELVDGEGQTIREVGREQGLWANPVRSGHPFVIDVVPPVVASGIRVRAGTLAADSDGGGSFVHAWAEWFAFSQGRNVALGAEVSSSSGAATTAPWQWSKPFLTDGQTPLGLPEALGDHHSNVGWLSEGKPDAAAEVVLDIDLKQPRDFDEILLMPAKRPTSDLPAGFGFPEEFEILSGPTRGALRSGKRFSMANPGHNPVRLAVEGRGARFVRLRVDKLWKPFDSYPAFCAFSEFEVLHQGVNVAAGCPAISPDGMGNVVAPGGRNWGPASLTDGYGPDGKLIPVSDWLGLLDDRLRVETEIHALRQESARLVRNWGRGGVVALAVGGLLALGLLVVLPVRFRLREKSKLIEVRERIAGDLHDEVGSNLGSIQMFADLAEGRSGKSEELRRIQRIAAETVSAVRDIVWLLRPHGGHRIATVEHLRETASIMLERLDWKFTADETASEIELSDEASRHLFLYFREALHNILRHASATEATVKLSANEHRLQLDIRDNGVGIPEAKMSRSSTLRALRQRAESLGAEFRFESGEGKGTRLVLVIPIGGKVSRSQGLKV